MSETKRERALPIVVDLDGTLLRTDLLLEALILHLKQGLLGAFRVLGWLGRGRSHLKRRLAEAVELDVELLPCHEELVAWLREEHARGREIHLATASDDHFARAVAERFDFIDEVFASDGESNLKGRHKAARLEAAFPDGFCYAGDSSADLAVWRVAREGIVVDASGRTVRRARRATEVTRVFPRPSQGLALARGARLHQWLKNTLVFVPLVLSGQLFEPSSALRTGLAFLALGLVASSNYLVNDLWDLGDDRAHWSKRHRPLASGRLHHPVALGFVLVGMTSGFGLAFAIDPAIAAAIALYLGVSLSYSFKLKRIPIVDSFVLASLYSLRLVIGIIASRANPSEWLIVFSMFVFSSLSLAKRYTEIQRVEATPGAEMKGRGYVVSDGPLVLGMGLAAGVGAVLIMVLYLINDAFQQSFYGNVIWLWGFPATLHLFVCRLWLTCHRGELDDDPIVFTLKDRPSQVLLGVALLCFGMAWAG